MADALHGRIDCYQTDSGGANRNYEMYLNTKAFFDRMVAVGYAERIAYNTGTGGTSENAWACYVDARSERIHRGRMGAFDMTVEHYLVVWPSMFAPLPGTEPVASGEDTTPPTFAGLTNAAAIDGTSATLEWNAATDDQTATDAIWYQIHCVETSGAPFTVRTMVLASDVLPPMWESIEGAIPCSYTLKGLNPETTYFAIVRAMDAANNVDTNSVELSFTTTVDAAGTLTVNVISPTPGSTITTTTPFVVEVTDDSGAFRRVILTVQYERSGVVEVVHDGDGFKGHYASSSSRSLISGGWRYNILRAGGWTSSPTFEVYAIDRQGNEGR